MMPDPRNRNLNAAFRPRWAPPEGLPSVIPGTTGDTNFDPFAGTGWDRWLDQIGAGDPGGVDMAGGRALPNSTATPSLESMRLDNALSGIGDAPISTQEPSMGDLRDPNYVGNANKPGRRRMDRDLANKYPGVR